MLSALAHALPHSIGALPLTLVLTSLLAAYLAAGALGTRRAAGRVSARRSGEVVASGRPEGSVAPSRDGEGSGAEPGVAEGSVAAGGRPQGSVAPSRDGEGSGAEPGVVAGADLSAWHILGVAGLLLVAALATFGPADASSNLTDQAVLSLLWGAVALSSIAVGVWWHRVDPIRGLSGMLARAVGDPDHDLARPLPPAVAIGAAVAGLVTWAWVQLLVTPSVAAVQLLLLLYVAVHVAGATRYGPTWLRAAEPLNVLSATMGMLRPGGGGPMRRLVGLADGDRLRWICGALIAWSLVDLVTETTAWHDLGAPAWVAPVLLVGAVVAVYGAIRAVSSRFCLGPAFVAVAGSWVVAHYLSILIIEGQGLPIWLSDPFASGADLFGRRGGLIDLEPVPLGVLAALQSIPFIVGHLAAVVVVQRRAALVVPKAGQIGPATFFARTLIAALLLGGTYLQLGGV